MPHHDLLEIINSKPKHTKRVIARLEEIINHPNPYNHRPDVSDLSINEQAAFIFALDGYGLRNTLERRWGKEQERRLWARSHDKNYVPDPLEIIQEIP